MLYRKYKLLINVTGVIFVLASVWEIYQILYLRKAHSSFENYYAFRGCTQLVNKTEDMGVCKTASGQTIKIVKYDNRWFLYGDLPCGFLCF
jgi:hypothetical protein